MYHCTGRRHADETIRLDPVSGELDLQPSSTLAKRADGSIEPVVDFIVSGEGYFALNVLMKAISLSMNIQTRDVDLQTVITNLTKKRLISDPYLVGR